MKIELLTREHCEKFEGGVPPVTVKGIAMTDGDKVLAICCTSVIEGQNFVICGVAEGASKRLIIEGWGIFSQMLLEEVNYYALVDEDLPTAPGFLKHFGFEPFKDDIYIYRGR